MPLSKDISTLEEKKEKDSNLKINSPIEARINEL
jgi:hypothetical protein